MPFEHYSELKALSENHRGRRSDDFIAVDSGSRPGNQHPINGEVRLFATVVD